jgi:hypothetical protein
VSESFDIEPPLVRRVGLIDSQTMKEADTVGHESRNYDTDGDVPV